jgi:hypothetical protein
MAISISIVSVLGILHFVDVPLQFSPYSLIPDFPIVIWIALFSVILGLLLVLANKKKQKDSTIILAIIVLVTVFYGIMTISERNLTYTDSWTNILTAEKIFENGRSSLTYSADSSWPSFYIFFAEFKMVTGIDFFTIARFLPTILNCLAFAWIFILFRKLGLKNKAALIAIIALILVDTMVYTDVSPTNFAFALYCSLLYLVFIKKQTSQNRSYMIIFLLLFATIVTSHALIPAFLLFPMLLFPVVAFVLKQNNKIVRIGNEFYAGIILWIFWNVFAIAPFWWQTVASYVHGFFSHVSTLSSPISRSLNYFLYGTPPLGIQLTTFLILGLILSIALIGFFAYIIQSPRWLRARNTLKKNMYWSRFLVLFSLFVGCIITALIPYFLLGGTVDTSKVLLFIWIPVVFFVGTVFAKLKRKRRQIFSILLILLLIPAFCIFNWNEFWLSNHDWELSSAQFIGAKAPPSTIITDSYSSALIHYYSPNSTFESEGLPEKPELALPAFLGNVPPTELKWQNGTLIQWNYFVRSARQSVIMNIDFGTGNQTLSKLDTYLSKPPINRIYDNGFVQIYER